METPEREGKDAAGAGREPERAAPGRPDGPDDSAVRPVSQSRKARTGGNDKGKKKKGKRIHAPPGHAKVSTNGGKCKPMANFLDSSGKHNTRPENGKTINARQKPRTVQTLTRKQIKR